MAISSVNSFLKFYEIGFAFLVSSTGHFARQQFVPLEQLPDRIFLFFLILLFISILLSIQSNPFSILHSAFNV